MNHYKNNFVFFLFLFLFSTIGTSQVTLLSKQTFNYTGFDQALTIPTCATSIKVKVWGAGGGGSFYTSQYAGGGAGGYTEGFLTVNPGDVFSIMVGEGGVCDGASDFTSYGFGGTYSALNFGGFGGGLSGIFTGNASILPTDQSRALLIAGGGGGGERDAPNGYCSSGGQGGDVTFGGGMPTMQGENGGAKTGGGGGGGYNGGLMSLRLSGNGIYHGGEGGTNFIHTSVTSNNSLASADFGNWNVFPALYKDPPNTADPDYTAWVNQTNPGIGTGNMHTNYRGGHGRVVVEFYGDIPSVSISSASTNICQGTTATLTTNASGGTAPYTYAWNPSGQTTSSIAIVSSGNYSVTITDSFGCTITNGIIINSITSPTVTAVSNPVTSCITPNGDATASVSGGTASYTYAWNNGQTSSAVNNMAIGTYTIVVTDGNGCTHSATVNVTSTISQPTVSATSTAVTLCSSNNGSATATTTGGTGTMTYLWSDGQNTATAVNLAVGNYTVTITDGNGCTATTTVNVGSTIVSPTVTISSTTQPGCSQSNGTATASASGGTGSSYTYFWDNGQSAAMASNLSAGTYTVTVTDGAGCTATTTVTLASPAAPVIGSVSASPTSCSSPTGTATVTASGGTGGLTYDWSTTPPQNTAVATNLGVGSYTITITDASNCSASSIVNVTIVNGPTVTVASTSVTCATSNGSASAAAIGGSAPYTYSWSNGETTSTITDLIGGTYYVTVTDAAGCSQIQMEVVVAALIPDVTITASPSTMPPGGNSQLSSAVVNVVSYLWSPTDGLSCVTCPNPIATPTSSTQYCVEVASADGCTDTSCLQIEVKEIICGVVYLPNAFSPNNDGDNDVLYVYGNCIKELELKIYNRWGEKVFETNDPQEGWDGTSKTNKEENTASFTYYLNTTLTTGDKISKKGNVSIVR